MSSILSTLTTQGFCLGVATFLALMILAPGGPKHEIWVKLMAAIAAGILVAYAVSVH
jgi:hypothetical protein